MVWSKRGDEGRCDQRCLEVRHHVRAHNISRRALAANFGPWNTICKRFWRRSQSRTFEAFFQAPAARNWTAG